MTKSQPIWTGRYGAARDEVIAKGRDFVVVNYDTNNNQGRRPELVDPALKSGVHVFALEIAPKEDDLGLEGFGEGFTDLVYMRAYNAEDAARNWWGAISQWHVWTNYRNDVELNLDWETAPFTDEDGNFPPDGGDHGGIGFDAAPPDDTAKDGITRPDLFTADRGFLAVGLELDRAEALGTDPGLG